MKDRNRLSAPPFRLQSFFSRRCFDIQAVHAYSSNQESTEKRIEYL
jgi:hypothetical protein